LSFRIHTKRFFWKKLFYADKPAAVASNTPILRAAHQNDKPTAEVILNDSEGSQKRETTKTNIN
jgi:hypothetical protein